MTEFIADNDTSGLIPTEIVGPTTKLKISITWLKDCDFLGLFANQKIIQGEIICKYTGDIHRTVPALRLKDKSYLMRLGEQVYVDALAHPDVKAR